MNVLIINNKKSARDHIAQLLADTQPRYLVSVAGDATDAVTKLKNLAWHCVLVDADFWQAAGRTFTYTVTALCDSRNIVLLRTGYVDPGEDSSLVNLVGMRPDRLGVTILSAVLWAERDAREREIQKRVREINYYDPLTGLATRHLFFDRLHHTIEHGKRHDSRFTVLQIEINNMKTLNADYGNATVDSFLKRVAERIQQHTRNAETFARIGGDQFAALLPSLSEAAELEAFIARLQSAIAEPMDHDNSVITIDTAIGTATYPQHGTDAEALMTAADLAMQQARQTARPYALATEKKAKPATMHRQIRKDMPAAIRDGNFLLEYQPKVSLQTGEIVGFEALARWSHIQHGLISAADFIPEAEKTVAIRTLTFKLFDEVLRQMQHWQSAGETMQIAFNLSARLLDDRTTADKLLARLDETGVPASQLTFEITESARFTNSETALGVVNALRDAGASISIDDFGTGHFSFEMLRNAPFDEIKIDKRFIEEVHADSGNQSIVNSILELGSGFDVKIVAEGIENEAAAQYLNALGCSIGQGYLYSRPVAADDVLSWLDDWRRGQTG